MSWYYVRKYWINILILFHLNTFPYLISICQYLLSTFLKHSQAVTSLETIRTTLQKRQPINLNKTDIFFVKCVPKT